ncbi:MAG: tetratricopeptide repeat protein, partial [bacterium]|nr:tetratricopeptide repeat protein [bacterium]
MVKKAQKQAKASVEASGADLNKNLFDLALQSQRQGKWTHSLWLYQRLLELSPENASVYSNMGALFSSHHQFEPALALLEKSVELDPKHPGALSNLGNAYQRQGNFSQAEKHLKKSIKLAPDHFSAHLNLAIALRRQGKIKEALKYLKTALNLSPDNADANFNKAVCHLSLGELEKAWDHYEYRWGMREAQNARRQFPQPLWDGQKLENRTLFIYCEQGFGDAIQFARYIPKAAERVGKIIVECRPELVRLFQSIEGVSQIVSQGQTLPDFDAHIPLLSLP